MSVPTKTEESLDAARPILCGTGCRSPWYDGQRVAAFEIILLGQGMCAAGDFPKDSFPPEGTDSSGWYGPAGCRQRCVLLRWPLEDVRSRPSWWPGLFLVTLLYPPRSVAQDEVPSEPEIMSVFPMGGKPGTTVMAQVRGQVLEGAYAVWTSTDGLRAEVTKVEEVDLNERYPLPGIEHKNRPGQQVSLRLQIDSETPAGVHSLRLVSPRGVSNELDFHVSPEPAVFESSGLKQRQPQTIPLPVVVHGKISAPGQVDSYEFEVSEGQQLLVDLISSREALANVTRFRPQVTLYEVSGSWFDPNRTVRLAFDDGATTDAVREITSHDVPTSSLTYGFSKAGSYRVEVGSTYGTGGPDYVYQLRVAPATDFRGDQLAGPLVYKEIPVPREWRERIFTRKIEDDRLKALWARTVEAPYEEAATEAGRGTAEGAEGPSLEKPATKEEARVTTFTTLVETEPNDERSQARAISIPGLAEGIINRPGDSDFFEFEAKPDQSLAFEIETPEAGPVRFNPRLEILDAEGREVLTNLYKKIKQKDSVTYVKALSPKTVHTFQSGGKYYLRVSDVTHRYGGPDYRYRVLVRPRVPHVGELEVDADRVNLVAGRSKKLTLTSEQEEGFSGEVAVVVEGLPPGVRILPVGIDVPEPRPAAEESIKKESYVPNLRKASVLLLAESAAPVTNLPTMVRVAARPIVGGELGPLLVVKEIPFMVVPPAEDAAEEQRTGESAP